MTATQSQRSRRFVASRRQRAHLDPGQSRDRCRLSIAPPAIGFAASARCASIFWSDLADLIRPALAWREGAPGRKPAGGFSGRRLHDRQRHDVADRRLGRGFRLGPALARLPHGAAPQAARTCSDSGSGGAGHPAPEQAPEPVSTDGASAAEDNLQAVSPAPEAEPMAEPAAADDEGPLATSEAEAAPEAETVSSEPPEPSDSQTKFEAEPAPATEAQAPEEAEAAPAAEAEASETPAVPQPEGGEVAAEAEQATAEPALIEVWRPGRAEGRRRPRDRHRDHGRPRRTDAPRGTPGAEAPAVAASGEAAPAAEQPAGEAPGRSGRPHRHRQRGGEHRGGEHRGGEHRDRPDRPPRERERPRERPARFERREREKAPDPNSPFAKLAALKAQLEAEAKERR